MSISAWPFWLDDLRFGLPVRFLINRKTDQHWPVVDQGFRFWIAVSG
jgi:hypothetical protein